MSEGPPFFIVGSARSGTTLLRMVLDSHPDVGVPPESRFIVELYQGRDRVSVDTTLDRLERHPRFRLWDLPIEAVSKELPDSPELPYAEVMAGAYRAYVRREGKTRWGDKTPRYVEAIPLLARLWPQARFIHLVRDGRNVALSYADVPFGPKTVGAAARLWGERVRDGVAEGRAVGADRYLELHYEDLVEDPEEEIKNICAFLDLAFDEVMLSYEDQARARALQRARHYNPNVMRPPIKQVRSWEEKMAPGQIEMFEATAGDVLSELGYPRRYERPSLRARVGARLGALGLPIGRLRSSWAPADGDPATTPGEDEED